MSLNDTCQHYRDNRSAYAFSHTRDLFDAGALAVLYGGGASCSTQPATDGGYIQAQGAIAYDLPATPTGLNVASTIGPIVRLHWQENNEPDLWGYQLRYQLIGNGSTYTQDVGPANAATLLMPIAGQWQVTIAAYDVMGQLSPASSAVLVTTSTDAEAIYLPLVRR
jgi:hypothetical protein